MSTKNDNWLKEMFIDQAKPALDRHSGGGGASEAELEAAREEGRQAEYDRFWDNFQQNGNRTRYVYGFAGVCWTKETLKPKYPIKAEEGFRGCQCMFRDCNWNNPELIDYSLIKDKIDFSKCTMAAETFCCSWIDNIDVDFSNCEQLSQTFATNDNGNMPHIRLKVSEKAVFDRTFLYNSSTKELIFTNDSVIGQNGLNVQWTSLTHDSLMSIINVLKDYSTDTSGTEWKIKIGSENYAKLTTQEIEIAINKGWAIE